MNHVPFPSIDAQLRTILHEVVASCVSEAIAKEIKPMLEELRRPSVPDPMFVTVAEAARRLAVHPATVREWMRAGRLRTYRMGSRIVRLRADELQAAMASEEAVPVVDLDSRAQAILGSVSRRPRRTT